MTLVRKLGIIALGVLLIAAPQAALASSDVDLGRIEGERDGRADVSQWLWLGAGCVFNVLGVGAAYLIVPSPSATRLLGKSSEYTAAYTEAYQNAARNTQVKSAMIGCGINAAFWVLYWVFWVLVLGNALWWAGAS